MVAVVAVVRDVATRRGRCASLVSRTAGSASTTTIAVPLSITAADGHRGRWMMWEADGACLLGSVRISRCVRTHGRYRCVRTHATSRYAWAHGRGTRRDWVRSPPCCRSRRRWCASWRSDASTTGWCRSPSTTCCSSSTWRRSRRLRMQQLSDRVVLSRSRVSRVVDEMETSRAWCGATRIPTIVGLRSQRSPRTAGRRLRKATPVYLQGIDARVPVAPHARRSARSLERSLRKVFDCAAGRGRAGRSVD